jgi:hypothetical protein
MGLEDWAGEALQDGALEGGVRFHLVGLGFLVALVLGGLGSVDSWDPGKLNSQLTDGDQQVIQLHVNFFPSKKWDYSPWQTISVVQGSRVIF